MAFQRTFPAPSILRLVLSLVVVAALALPARAVTLLRDADLEYGLKELAAPVLRAAGLNPNRVKILVVDDGSLNAFIVSQDAIFINSGLIGRLERAAQLQAVIAHEAAHIANGHITRRMTNLRSARTAAGLGLALAAVAAAAGSEAAPGIAIGTASSAQRLFFRHTQAEESSADQTGLRLMRSAGVDPQALIEVLELFRGQELLAEQRQDPYVRSHPLSRDRIRAATVIAGAGDTPPENAASRYWFARVKGKLTAYQRGPKWTLRRAGESGYNDVAAIRRAVAYLRQSNAKRALAEVEKALAQRPKDPFLHDLKGEILLKTRAFPASVSAYARATQLAPNEALILAGHGRALLATDQVAAARKMLERARAVDYRDTIMLRDLSVAYARSGQTGMAALVTAERYALSGRLKDAGIHAKRATDLLPRGSGPWQQAQDVLIAAERAAK